MYVCVHMRRRKSKREKETGKSQPFEYLVKNSITSATFL